ncbi:MAG: hemolysin III family protein [Clostridia bacterium]|nr:hemolysin III family protein [Clostridia bacterium]
MEIKEIKRKYKTEKRTIKREYRLEKKKRKLEYKKKLVFAADERIAEVAECARERGKRPPVNPPRRPVLEEIGNAVSHGVGALFGVVAFILMLLNSDGWVERVGASVYFFGLFVMFSMSCLYHAFAHGSAVKRLFRRFDYSGIYLLIGATFAPILLSYVGGTFGLVFFIVQWVIIVTGITFIAIFGPTRLKFLHTPLYLLLRWCGVIFIPDMLAADPWFIFYILGGGVIYSLGLIPFAMKTKVAHFIWHFFVLAGAVLQWVGVFKFIYLK